MQDTVGDWFHTSVWVRQGCLLSPTLFNILLESILTDNLEAHHGAVSIGGRLITNIDGLAGEEQELANLVNYLDKTSSRYDMEVSAEKTKLLTNRSKTIETKIIEDRS